MIVYVSFVHKKSVSKRKVCIIFIKIKKFKKPQKNSALKTFLVEFFGVFGVFFSVGFLLPTLTTGHVIAFGFNSHGQLGVGDLAPRVAPVFVGRQHPDEDEEDRVVRIAAGAYHSVALTASGRVLTWGYNGKGQLGRTGPVPGEFL